MTDIVERLRGIYRIDITDGLGATGGGDEPDNPNQFVRTFDVPPIHKEAADEIVRLRKRIHEVSLDWQTAFKDAERYQWLRDASGDFAEDEAFRIMSDCRPDEWDATIDAAMGEKK